MRLRSAPHVAVMLVCALAVLLYAAGLPGGFLLDDLNNLAGLALIKRDASLAGSYLMDSVTGFPGRPLSYLTFLAQAHSWPDDPAAFKVVNILLHAANGAMLFVLAGRLARLAGRPDGAAIGLLAAAIWLLHPIQVSTVLYVVQRMAQLAALATFAALVAYLHGRSLAAEGRTRGGYVWMSLALAIGTPVAILCKENGALIPLFVGVLEATVLPKASRPERWRNWAVVFIGLPALALAGLLGWTVLHADGAYAARSFSLSGRVYSEALILWDYIGKIVLPHPRAFGLYFDDYPVAPSPLHSGPVAVAMAGWAALLVAAFFFRRRFPLLFLAVLWYLAGHLLESTVIPLELYFDHRNYLPLAGPAVAAAWAMRRLWLSASGAHVRRTYAAAALLGLALLCAGTWIEARTWSDPVRQAIVWADEHPRSQRAQYVLASQYVFVGRFAEASTQLQRAEAVAPSESYFSLARLLIGCFGDVPVPQAKDVARRLATSPIPPIVTDLLDSLVTGVEEGRCRTVSTRDLLQLTDALRANPRSTPIQRWAAWFLEARVHAVEGQLDPAIQALESADLLRPNVGVTHAAVVWLVSAHLYDDALSFINRAREDPRWRPWQRAYNAAFLAKWERQVRQAAGAQAAAVERGT